jgi:hypothetical protein
MRRTALAIVIVLLVGAEHGSAQSAAPPDGIQARIDGQEVCICNEDYTECLCCETVAAPPFVACDIVINGEDVTGRASFHLRMKADGTTKIRARTIRIQPR